MLLLVCVSALFSLSSSSSPVCSDSSTYTSYGHTTKFKGLLNTIPWDLDRNTDQGCNMTDYTDPSQPNTCGDCDFNLQEKVWYRFDKGPYSKIAEMPDDDYCPKPGHCNGFGQIALVKNEAESNSTVFKYAMAFSKPPPSTDCSKFPSVVEAFNCTDFLLYKFAKGWNGLSGKCTTTTTIDHYTPYSLCMEDAVLTTTLTTNRLLYPGYTAQTPSLSCTSSSYPTRPTIHWSTGPTQDPAEDPFTATSTVSGINASTNPTVQCSTQNLTATFYRVDITTANVAVQLGDEVEGSCEVKIHNYTDTAGTLEFYLISKARGLYYTPDNLTDMSLNQHDDNYTVTLRSSPNATQSWSCGVRDPGSGLYLTQDFTITTISSKMGLLYYVVGGVVGGFVLVGAVVLVIRWRRRGDSGFP